MNGFWDQFGKSNIISGILAVSLTGAVIYLAVTGQPIPDLLGAALTAIIGFFFGTKTGEWEGRRAMVKEYEPIFRQE